ncbi:MAG: 50S ribosomal protein L22 [Patescibacteria group bacterium]
MTNIITAKLKYLRLPHRKTRFVANLIKGLPVDEAEAQLMLNSRRASPVLLKLLKSAISNAKNNNKLSSDSLYIKDIRVNQGNMFTRYTPRAKGSASPIQKKTSHVILVLGVREAKPPKFLIKEREKKVKKTVESKKDTENKFKDKDKKAVGVNPISKPGFFKRVFSRKSI